MSPPERAAPGIAWKTPSGWEQVPPSQMRVGSFRIKDSSGKTADVSVIPLPGLAGGDLDNVNRWRGQVGLSPTDDEDLKKASEPVTIAGSTAQLYDLAGQAPGSGDTTRILGAILRREGVAWFFKMTGADDLVSREKAAFKEFLTSLSFTDAERGTTPSAGGNMSVAALPENHPPIDSAPMAQASLPLDHPPLGGAAGTVQAGPASGGPGKLGIDAPAGWKEVPGGQFLFAKYVIENSDGQTAVNVSTSAGDGGGIASNINRWRGQLGLTPLSSAEVEKLTSTLEVSGGKATLVELAGNDPKSGAKSKILGAIVPRGSATWFFKMMGPESTVSRERDAFLKVIQSAKYPDAR